MADALRLDGPVGRSARGLAFIVLDEHRRSALFVADRLDQLFRENEVAEIERPLARAIALGVLRRRSTLDAVLEAFVARPRARVEPELWSLMQIGVFQLLFLDGIPSRAAINETVELTRVLGRPRWAGFLNGVLRSVDRSATDDAIATPAANAIPIETDQHRVLDRDVLPSPTDEPGEYVAAAFGLPRWLVKRWQGRSSFEELLRLGFWFDRPPGLTLRANVLRTTRDALLQAIRDAGHAAEAGTSAVAIRLEQSVNVAALPGFDDGWFSVQDESAMSAAELLAPRPGERVLDACAAPGTKTTHLAELMKDDGRLVACDVSADRLARVTENAQRLGFTCVEAELVTDETSSLPVGPFDAILLDVPCSNTGVLGKRPEARWRLRAADLVELPTIQRDLLTAALERLAPDGRLVYSTCSIEPEENEELVRTVLHQRADFVVEREIRHEPGRPADGAYQALLRRNVESAP